VSCRENKRQDKPSTRHLAVCATPALAGTWVLVLALASTSLWLGSFGSAGSREQGAESRALSERPRSAANGGG